MFEGAQGTMLDIDHGTYPFVTSSSAAAGGACTGTGVAPTRIDGVLGVSKAYITRVGGGPFPTEALDDQGELIRARGKEFGAVTGRPRRCGWFDVPLLRYTATINGFDSLVVTKLDVLDAFEADPRLRRLQAGRHRNLLHARHSRRNRPHRARLRERAAAGTATPSVSTPTTPCPPKPRTTSPSSRTAPASKSAASPPVPSATRPSSARTLSSPTSSETEQGRRSAPIVS